MRRPGVPDADPDDPEEHPLRGHDIDKQISTSITAVDVAFPVHDGERGASDDWTSNSHRPVHSSRTAPTPTPSSPMPSSASYYSGQRRHSRQRRLAAAECARRKESGASDPGAESSSSGVPFFLCADPSAMDSQSSPVTAAAPGDPLAFNATWSSVQPRHHHPHPSFHQRVPLLNSPDLQLRFLSPSDIPEVKRLCKEWFPIDYPDAWYSDITSNPKFFSMACVYHARIIGLVVAEIRDYFALAKEDSEILAPTFRSGTKIGYILSLGVVREYRKNGVASFLLDNLLSHLTSTENWDVRAVYLHVLTTNFPVN